MHVMIVWMWFVLSSSLLTEALDNGLALTPPMGWLSWLRYGCQTDCEKHPLSCINELLIMNIADRMVQNGYKDAGYEFVIIDDCWLATTRDGQDRLQPDPKRFPHGIKWLSDYVHSVGLKFGIYEAYGTKTCAGYPGTLDHIEVDAQTFADWGVDYLKLDACNVDHGDVDIGYPQMSRALNKTGRQIVYGCSWAVYNQFILHHKPNYTALREFCNLWRVFEDISIDWASVLRTINYFDTNQDDLISANGPGSWNDPDMISVGDPGLSIDQAKAQFGMWAIWSAPLLMSNDLSFIAPSFREILLNKKVIAVNQDPMGKMGRLIVNTTNVAIYLKPVVPVKKSTNQTSFVVAFLNRSYTDKANVTVRAVGKLGLTNSDGYNVEDLYSGQQFGFMNATSLFQTIINSGSIVLLKATVV